MKVAILTLTGENNYGNKLQNYALQYVLEKQGCDVSTIRVTDKEYVKPLVRACIQYPISCFLPDSRKNRVRRRVSFCLFNKKIHQQYKGISQQTEDAQIYKILSDYDYIFYGSDQIWNVEFPLFSEIYLGKYAQKDKNIAISASFGTSNIPVEYHNMFYSGLNRFQAISVRENDAVNIVKDLSGIDAIRLIDPTMAVPAKHWVKLEKRTYVPPKYVLSYFLGKTPDTGIDEVFRRYNSEVITASPSSEYGPGQFLYLVHHADAIITDSFHACVFAFIFDKELNIFSRKDKYSSMSSRISTLLDITNVEYSQEEECILISKNNIKIDYVRENIEKERDRFYNYVNNILNGGTR